MRLRVDVLYRSLSREKLLISFFLDNNTSKIVEEFFIFIIYIQTFEKSLERKLSF